MGNKEFSLIKFPIVEEERVVFLLYHMNITPRAITHMPRVTNRATIRKEVVKKGSFHLYFQEHY